MRKKYTIGVLYFIILLAALLVYTNKPLYEFIYFLGIIGILFLPAGIFMIIGQKLFKKWERSIVLPALAMISFYDGYIYVSIILTISTLMLIFYELYKFNEKIDFKFNMIKWHILNIVIGGILIVIFATTFPQMIINVHNEFVLSENRIELYEEKYNNVELYKNNIGQQIIPDIWDSEINDCKITFSDIKTLRIQDSSNVYILMHYAGAWRIVDKESLN